MEQSLRYTKGRGNAALYLRLRGPGMNYYDFTAKVYIAAESSACKIFGVEIADNSITEADYLFDFTPPRGSYTMQIVDSSTNEVIGEEEETALSAAIIGSGGTMVENICNSAILVLGGSKITSFADASAEAVLCSQFWEQSVDAVLRLHPWNCAIKRTTLTPDVTAPEYEWTYAFTLPADLIRLLDLDDVTDYKVEGQKVLCDESALNIKYVFRNSDPATWDRLLVEAMTAYMAFKLAYPLTKSNTTRGEQWKLFTELLRTAKNVDAQEEPGDTIGDFPFLRARHY